MISAAKRKQLEEAGYKVNKSGKTVQHPEGGTVAGINENGNVFGSGKAFDILKGSSKKAPKKDSDTKAREKPKERKTKTSSRSSSAPTESKRPKQRQMGRGEPNYGKEADKPVESPMGGPRRGRTPAPTRDRREGTTLLRSPDRSEPKGILQSVAEKRKKAQETLAERRASEAATQARQDSAPTFSSYMNEKRKENPEAFREDPSGFTQKMREMYKTTYGFNKGGMVRKGNISYKDKGMFYKSASPRGYK